MILDIENYKAKRRDYVLAKYIIKALRKQKAVLPQKQILKIILG